MNLIPKGLIRYGLDDNPFKPRILDPLSRQNDSDLFVRVDGFNKLDSIREQFDKTIKNNKPLFCLVAGRNHTGRTSVANFILAEYCKQQNLPHDKLIVPKRIVDNHDEFTLYKRWLVFLSNEIRRRKINLPQQLQNDIREEIRAVDRDIFEATFQDLTYRISDSLSENTSFGVCLENVPTYQIIKSAMEIFELTNTVVIFTVDDYSETRQNVIDPFKAAAKEKDNLMIIEITPLNGQDVCAVVQHRWSYVSGEPNPFDIGGVKQAFSDKERPLGKALFLLAQLLDVKNGININGPKWPAEELKFSSDELCQLV